MVKKVLQLQQVVMKNLLRDARGVLSLTRVVPPLPPPFQSPTFSRLSAATLSDKEKLQVFLNGLRVVDLRQELKDRKYSFQGISKASKSQLVSHLLVTGNWSSHC